MVGGNAVIYGSLGGRGYAHAAHQRPRAIGSAKPDRGPLGSDQAAGGSTASLVNGVLPVRLSLIGIRRIVVGAALIAMSLLALVAPLTNGTWSLQFLSLFPLAVGLSDLHATVTNPQLRTHPTAYTATVCWRLPQPCFYSLAHPLPLTALSYC